MGLLFQRELRINATHLPDELDRAARSLAGESVRLVITNHPAHSWIMDCEFQFPYSTYIKNTAVTIGSPQILFAPKFWIRRPPIIVDRNFRVGGTTVSSIIMLPWEELIRHHDQFTIVIQAVNDHHPPISDEGGLIEIEIATDNQNIAEQVKNWLGGSISLKRGTTFAYTHELVYFFRPPVRSASYFPEGVFNQSPDLFARISSEPNLLNKHILICGQTGYGKTNTAKLLLDNVVHHSGIKGILILDPHGQYGDWARKHNILYISAGRRPEELRKLHINPFIPLRHQRLDAHLDLLSIIFSISAFRGSGINLPSYIRQLLRSFFQEIWSIDKANLRKVLRATGEQLISREYYRPAVSDYNLLEQFCKYWHTEKSRILRKIAGGQAGSNFADLSGVITARINELEMSFLADFDYSSTARSASSLLNQKVVISLQGASEADIDLIVSFLSLTTVESALLQEGSNHLQYLIVIEEAHKVMARVSLDSAEFSTASQRLSSAFQTAFRELRSRGVGVVAIDQSPHTLIDEAFANTSIKIAHHMELPDDQRMIQNVFQSDELDLTSFDIGECMIKVEGNPAYRTKVPLW